MASIFRQGRFQWHEGIIALFFFAVSFWLYESRMDLVVTDWSLTTFSEKWMQDIWGLLSRAGQAWFQIVVCVPFAIYYYRQANYQMARVWYMAIPIFLACGVVGAFFKNFFGRPRPKMWHGHELYDFQWFELPARMHSYPSGHTLTTFCLLATVFPFYGRKGRTVLILIACLLGYARVGLGSHYLGDVVAGAVLGYCIGKLLRIKFKLSEKRK